MASDLENVLRQEAAQCRRLAELVTEQEAQSHEDRNDERSSICAICSCSKAIFVKPFLRRRCAHLCWRAHD